MYLSLISAVGLYDCHSTTNYTGVTTQWMTRYTASTKNLLTAWVSKTNCLCLNIIPIHQTVSKNGVGTHLCRPGPEAAGISVSEHQHLHNRFLICRGAGSNLGQGGGASWKRAICFTLANQQNCLSKKQHNRNKIMDCSHMLLRP
jgi:hypothetical protein